MSTAISTAQKTPAAFDQRRHKRVALTAPMRILPSTAMAGKIPKGFNAQSQNLSGGGLYLTTEEVEFIRIGAVLRVSLAVPWKLRGNIPFSRISGSCRVVRIDDKSKEEKDLVGVAIAFCGNDLTMLGTMTGPAA